MVRLQLPGVRICHCEAARPLQSPELWKITVGRASYRQNPPTHPFTKGKIPLPLFYGGTQGDFQSLSCQNAGNDILWPPATEALRSCEASIQAPMGNMRHVRPFWTPYAAKVSHVAVKSSKISAILLVDREIAGRTLTNFWCEIGSGNS